MIRLGNPDGDGGYLVPDDLDGIAACFSPGTNFMVDFEKDVASRGIKCFLADGSIKSPPADSNFHFIRRNLGLKDSMLFIDKLRRRTPQMRFDTWVNRYSQEGDDLLLQMDIEGEEFAVLDDVANEILARFRIMVIEFHRLRRLLPYIEYHQGSIIYRVFEKLAQSFSVVHIHPNNANPCNLWGKYQLPDLVEITFLRQDRITEQTPTKEFPHELDRINREYYPPLEPPKIFYT